MSNRKELQLRLETTLDEVIDLMMIYHREIGGYSAEIVNKLAKVHELSNLNSYSKNKVNEGDLSIRKRISKTLLAMGIPTSHIAHNYIIDLVEMGIENINNIKPFNKVGYVKIQEKYHRSASSVEQAIRKSIESGMDYNNFEIWEQITGYSDDFPTVSNLITGLIEHFKD